MVSRTSAQGDIRKAISKRPSLDELWVMDYNASDIKEEWKPKADRVAAVFARGLSLESAAKFLEDYKERNGGLPSEPGTVDGSEQYYAWAISQLMQSLAGLGAATPGFDKRQVRDAICALFAEGRAISNCSEETELGIKTKQSRAQGGANSADPSKTKMIGDEIDKVRAEHPDKSKEDHYRLVAKRLNMKVSAIKGQVFRNEL